MRRSRWSASRSRSSCSAAATSRRSSAQFFARIGVPTTFVLRAPHLLSTEDDDVGDALTDALRAEGIRVETCAQVERAERSGRKKRVVYAQHGASHSVEADEILYALGRVPNVDGLNLEAADVRYHSITGIEVDMALRTSNPSIFAVGDVTGMYPLVHVAIYQGELAARNAVLHASDRADYTSAENARDLHRPAGRGHRSDRERAAARRRRTTSPDRIRSSITAKPWCSTRR